MPHIAVTEPFWRVSEHSDTTNNPCITICEDPDECPRKYGGNARDPAEVAVRHVFRIDRLQEAIVAARQIAAVSDCDRPNLKVYTDKVDLDPSFQATGTELRQTMAYNWRMAMEQRRYNPELGSQKNKDIYEDAMSAVGIFESTGEHRDVMIEKIQKIEDITGQFWNVIERLNSIPDAEYGPSAAISPSP